MQKPNSAGEEQISLDGYPENTEEWLEEGRRCSEKEELRVEIMRAHDEPGRRQEELEQKWKPTAQANVLSRPRAKREEPKMESPVRKSCRIEIVKKEDEQKEEVAHIPGIDIRTLSRETRQKILLKIKTIVVQGGGRTKAWELEQ